MTQKKPEPKTKMDEARQAAEHLLAMYNSGQPALVQCSACEQVFDLNDPDSAAHHMQPSHLKEKRH